MKSLVLAAAALTGVFSMAPAAAQDISAGAEPPAVQDAAAEGESAAAPAWDEGRPARCPDVHDRRIGTFTFSYFWFRRSQRCAITVRSDASEALFPRGRTYSVYDDGMLMVFNSYGDGKSSTHTGARVFYLFPRQEFPRVRTTSSDEPALRLASGHEIRFDSETGRTELMTEATLTESAEYPERPARGRFTHDGGVNISGFSGLMLDVGFRFGGSPHAVRGGRSRFTDRSGNHCTVRNTEIFDYDAQGEVSFKFKTDAELAIFLMDHRTRACRDLDVTVLFPRQDGVDGVSETSGRTATRMSSEHSGRRSARALLAAPAR